MSETAVINNHQDEIENTLRIKKMLMMWLFLASDVMFFGAFISTYLIYSKSLVGPYPSQVLDIPITTVSTFILLMSSLAMVLALHYLKEMKKIKRLFGY